MAIQIGGLQNQHQVVTTDVNSQAGIGLFPMSTAIPTTTQVKSKKEILTNLLNVLVDYIPYADQVTLAALKEFSRAVDGNRFDMGKNPKILHNIFGAVIGGLAKSVVTDTDLLVRQEFDNFVQKLAEIGRMIPDPEPSQGSKYYTVGSETVQTLPVNNDVTRMITEFMQHAARTNIPHISSIAKFNKYMKDFIGNTKSKKYSELFNKTDNIVLWNTFVQLRGGR